MGRQLEAVVDIEPQRIALAFKPLDAPSSTPIQSNKTLEPVAQVDSAQASWVVRPGNAR